MQPSRRSVVGRGQQTQRTPSRPAGLPISMPERRGRPRKQSKRDDCQQPAAGPAAAAAAAAAAQVGTDEVAAALQQLQQIERQNGVRLLGGGAPPPPLPLLRRLLPLVRACLVVAVLCRSLRVIWRLGPAPSAPARPPPTACGSTRPLCRPFSRPCRPGQQAAQQRRPERRSGGPARCSSGSSLEPCGPRPRPLQQRRQRAPTGAAGGPWPHCTQRRRSLLRRWGAPAASSPGAGAQGSCWCQEAQVSSLPALSRHQ
jgi:hypothetical protein